MVSNNLKVLLVDDDSDDAEMIIYSLRKLPFVEVHHIDDGAAALQYLLNCDNEPGLVLLDLKMPRVDGIDILRALKSDQAKKHLPVAALISSKSGIHYVESFGLKPDAYLAKPVTCVDFLNLLTSIGLSNFKCTSVVE